MADQQYDNEMRGVLFKAREKRGPNSPDYNGNAQIGGVEVWISGWVKQGRNGSFLSLSFRRKDEDANYQPRQQTAGGGGGDGFMDEGGSRPGQSTRPVGGGGQTNTGRKKNDDWDDDIPF